MFPDVSAGAWSAFLAGLIVSPHCIGMCGPLYCSMVPVRRSGGESLQLSYHFGRVISYVSIGILAGALSLSFVQAFRWDISRFLPWALVGMLLLFALGLDKWIQPKHRRSPRFLSRWMLKSRSLPSEVSTLAMGLLTPLLPCAPLYMVLWVALVSGSPFFGAQIMLGFCLGTIPLLWLAQSQFLRHRQKWASGTIRVIQRSLALIAAIVIMVRMIMIGSPLDGAACFGM